LRGTLAALIAEDSPIDRVPGSASRIVLAASFIHPDASQPLQGLLELRDHDDQIADGFDPRRLILEVQGGRLSKPATRVGAGLYGFEVTAAADSGGQRLTLSLSFDDRLLTRRALPIGTDRWIAEGSPTPHGGCSFVAPASRGTAWIAAPALLLVGMLRRRRFTPWS